MIVERKIDWAKKIGNFIFLNKSSKSVKLEPNDFEVEFL